eukprot:364500-Chlamydomonas_euryale.AAC.32
MAPLRAMQQRSPANIDNSNARNCCIVEHTCTTNRPTSGLHAHLVRFFSIAYAKFRAWYRCCARMQPQLDDRIVVIVDASVARWSDHLPPARRHALVVVAEIEARHNALVHVELGVLDRMGVVCKSAGGCA